MERQVYTALQTWKNLPTTRRKPLILEGARQTGKTWLARELGRREFESFVEINFEQMTELRPLFLTIFDLNRILMAIQAVSRKKITPGGQKGRKQEYAFPYAPGGEGRSACFRRFPAFGRGGGQQILFHG